MGEIKSPVCPMCGEMPMLGWTQAFCGNGNCPVFTWNPHDTPEEFRRTARQIEIRPGGESGERA